MSEPDPTEAPAAQEKPTRRDFRTNPIDRRLLYAFLVSAAVHLSAVTVFKIVIYFQVPEISFYEFRFVQPPQVGPTATPQEREFAARWERLPKIEAPLLRDTGGQLTLARKDLESPTPYDAIYGEPERPLDTPRFSELMTQPSLELDRLRLGGSNLTLGPSISGNEQTMEPAGGFTGTLTWPQRDTARALLFGPPLQTLLSLDTQLLDQGVLFELSVDGAGRVTRVWTNMLQEGEDLEGVTAQLMQYRFEPESNPLGLDETVVLLIREKEATP